jgi:8-oxo-dGTP pyrophosphatase MutT (NUDIX family)
MHRNYLLKLIANYHPSSSEEIKHKEDIINFIKNNERCFDRKLQHGHITASAWLLNKTGEKALLTHHKKLDKWIQLGGHCDGDPDVLNVAIREIQEESGLKNVKPVHDQIFDIGIHFFVGNVNEEKHYHYDIRFLLQAQKDEKIKVSNESKDLKWISKNLDELPNNETSILRMFKKWVG